MRWGRVVVIAAVIVSSVPWPPVVRRLEAGMERWQRSVVGTWVAVLVAAQEEQRAAGHARIGSEHLLVALVDVGVGPAARWLRERGCEPEELRRRVRVAIDERAGDPQGVTAGDLAPIGAQALPVRPGVRVPTGRRRRAREYSEEAAAVLDTTNDRVMEANAGLPLRRRRLLEDDLAFALASTRGTRAWDLLRELDVDLDELRRVAGHARDELGAGGSATP